MAVFSKETQSFVEQLDAAVQAHIAWTRRLVRCAVLRQSPGDDLLAADAHCRCTFGRWFADNRSRFDEMDEGATARVFAWHRDMHDAARTLCAALLADERGMEADLDRLDASQTALVAELSTFKTRFLAASARIDALTGFPLRYSPAAEFERFRTPLAASGLHAMAMLIDIDHFKQINDRHGHGVGDRVLRHLADVMARQSGAEEPIFRMGGDEFLQLARVSTISEARGLAERMVQAVRDHPFVQPDGTRLPVSASAGCALVGTGESLAEALERADRALYD
ncbi:diguanylate cyclase, partial [bacterium]